MDTARAISQGPSSLCRREVLQSGLAVTVALTTGPARAAEKAKSAKYYFRVSEVSGDVDEEFKRLAADLLLQELQSRPEFTTTLEGVAALGDKPEALAPELKKRGMRGFDISLKVEAFTKELRDPRPGGRLKQLALSIAVSVFGAELPGKKIAFSGQGESLRIAEIFERRMEEETKVLTGQVLGDAIRQAVDQAVLKLTLPPSVPMNENKRKRARRRS